jgi:hypothetical protein
LALGGFGAGVSFAYGAGLYMANGKLTLSRDTVNSNAANNNTIGPGQGAGMYLAGGTVTLCNDTVENNLAFNGTGGIYIANNAKAYIDAFTLAHVDSIAGDYIFQNC